jgi:prophage maintenance system killer protein
LAINGISLTANEDAVMASLLPLYKSSSLTFEGLDTWLRANTTSR